MTPRLVLLVLLLLPACSPAPEGEPDGDVPIPGDWALVAPEARPLLDAAIARCRAEPGSPAAFAELGRAYHGNQQPVLALAAYERAVALAPSDPKTRYFLGLIRAERGETGQALDQLARARSLAPEYGPIAYHLGSVELESGRAREAEAAFREAVRLDPTNAMFLVGLARALRQAGRPEAALDAVNGALLREPGNLAAHQVAALVLKELKRDPEAAAHFAQGRLHRADVVRDPWFLEVQRLGASVAQTLARSDFMIESGKLASAVKVLEGLAHEHPKRADVHAAHARALARSGDLQRARGAYERALALDGDDPLLHAQLASVALDLGDVDGALAAGRAALAIRPDLPDVRVIIAAAKLRRGDAAGALADATAVATSRPDLPLAHVIRGDALLALGRPGDAVGAFDAALKIDRNTPYAVKRRADAAAAATRAGADSR